MGFNKKLFLSILLLLAGTLFLYSQNTCVIRGFVYEKETGEPIIFTNVYLLGTTYGASTDVNGFYNITRIPPGKYTLTVTYLGYDTIKEVITIKANEILSRKIYLGKSAINLGEINISAKKEEAKTQVQVSVTKITPREIKQI
ncbi:MAG: carboxypeptidase-like regulatory domain-containing protein, partial [Bacteroidales bacterium]|nr:carboxypeptidase-like regulatory domain-containing protein [Bacteroidales bacterium]